MSVYEYSRWDGQEFQPQSADEVFEKLSEHLIQHGDDLLRQLDDIDEDEVPELIQLIEKEGLIERDEEGKFRVSPKGIRRIQDKALSDLFLTFRRDGLGRHDSQQKGEGAVRLEDTRPYVYGDSLANLNMHETLKNAYIRQGGGVPIRLKHEDYIVHETEFQSRCATVVLIDMSGSMGRYGKYHTTKKVAVALQAMVRAQYPQDSIEMIGFYTFASPMTERQLLNSAPKPVSLWDSRVHLRFDLDNLPGRVPQHFTNIHAGLRLARSRLMRHGAGNKQIIVITDGEPTAHVEGREVVLIYPPAEKTATHTLNEARHCANAGIRISSFALIEDYFYLGLVNFVQEMARVSGGVAAYCSTEDLGQFVFESFVGGRHTRRHSK
ncbi:von Willebrand factor type A domain protein [Aquisphaera giovannonii]|uniref:von Willebrand factor type A domain protein n=1 Tax=Aquisphaera giovannonii TaxID=406548 RepID=A0A5B9WAG4_9BACT|nr:VWA domain-containing protein [Aquisphaera giovannonii]QEH37244.1 von Willebrand factor type A domain protein [Aquisphaera giovannonii]